MNSVYLLYHTESQKKAYTLPPTINKFVKAIVEELVEEGCDLYFDRIAKKYSNYDTFIVFKKMMYAKSQM